MPSPRRLYRPIAWSLWLLGAALCVLAAGSAGQAGRLVLVTDVVGAVGPATVRHVESVIGQGAERGASLVVLRMDTPGGLEQSMRDVNKAILGSPVPVAVYVAPAGARAASAGTYILYASHVAAMAPGTNLGAATPVRVGGGLPLPGQPEAPTEPAAPGGEDGGAAEGASPPPADTMSRKAVNDAAAYIRGLAELRGRDAAWAERAVRDADSLSAREALAAGVVDHVVEDVRALLAAADGRTVDLRGAPHVLALAGAALEEVEPGWHTRLLAVLSNPNIAFLLLMVGVYGLIFEFANPGTIGPGVVGIICLLLGMYALQLLPLDYAGVALVLVGIGFMVAEALTPSFGVLGLGGLVAFVIGASILVDADSPEFRLSWQVIAGTAIASAALLAVVLGYALRAQRRPVTTGDAELTGAPATVLEWQDGSGWVRARGERWQARGEAGLSPGAEVTVSGVHGLVLEVTARPPATQGDRT